VPINQVKGIVGKRELLRVGDLEMPAQVLLGEIGAGERDDGSSEVDAGDVGATFGKTGQTPAPQPTSRTVRPR
jgi:hypothetical protein